MISLSEFFKEYYSTFVYVKQRDEDMKLDPVIMYNNQLVFCCFIQRTRVWYEFNMMKPEVIAINANSIIDKYVPLTKDDINNLMHLLIEEGMWNDIINAFKIWNEDPDFEDVGYPKEVINSIPSSPPDYRLIWENGYTGKEDINFITTPEDYG